MRIAIVGAGIAGNTVALKLHGEHEITVFEAAKHVGGHADTHEVEQDGERYAVDTGFIVYNERTYPHFTRLLAELGVATQPSSMSFSVRCEHSGLEYNGTSPNTLFAQRSNLLRPAFYRMLVDVVRFNREARSLLEAADDAIELGDFLTVGRYSRQFIDHYLAPMSGAIWSAPPAQMLRSPARFVARFFHNHGLLAITNRPVWRTIQGGSICYVRRLTREFRDRIRLNAQVEVLRRLPNAVLIKAVGGEFERFDCAFLACHSNQALAMLADPSPEERDVLGAIPYQENEAVLHTDVRLLPRSRRAWAGWNCHLPVIEQQRVSLTYNLNILQRIDSHEPFLVTLNRTQAIDPRKVIAREIYHHPVYTVAGVASQTRHAKINGARRTFYCGAYWRYGFHEDGVVSALAAVEHFRRWRPRAATHDGGLVFNQTASDKA